MRTSSILMLAVLMAACGGEDGAAGAPGTDGASCSVAGDDGKATVTCDDGSTATVLDGTDGADGEDGTDGRDGKSGKDGADGRDGQDGENGASARVELTVACSGELLTTGLSYSYEAYVMTSGDVLVTGEVRDAQGSASATRVLTPEDDDYAEAPLDLTYDVDDEEDGGYFRIWLDREKAERQVEYFESADAADVATTWLHSSKGCTTTP